MALDPQTAVKVLQELDFHLYHAKSSGESLLIHSLSVYSLVHSVLPFTQIYSEEDKEMMRWAALLHDFGKTGPNWQKVKRGAHRVSPGDLTYEQLRSLLSAGIARYSADVLSDSDIEDILFIIEFHHDSGRAASTPTRSRMKDLVSECDLAVSRDRISDGLIRALNTIIDTIRYRLFTIELIDHPISPLAIGAFDYVLSETGSIRPMLFSATSTLYAAPADMPLPPLNEVNRFLQEQIGENKGALRFDNGQTRIFTDERNFLELALDSDAFTKQATTYADDFCDRRRKAAAKNPELWSDSEEEIYLYGRVCGATYNTLLKLCDVEKKKHPPACLKAGGWHGEVTVRSMEVLGFRQPGTAYGQTLKAILEAMKPYVAAKLKSLAGEQSEGGQPNVRYDIQDLLVRDTRTYGAAQPADPKSEAARDYARYMQKQALDICPACGEFRQGNVSAAAFPQRSPLGGTVEVFYTTHMRRIKKEPPDNKGVSFCSWCSKWWDRIATDPDGNRQLYRLCVMPHHLFGRLEWREVLGPTAGGILVELGESGTISTSGAYPHIAVMALRGKDREALLRELVADPERGEEQIVDRLYLYGLKGAVIVTNPVSSRHLLTCGSISIDGVDWPILRKPLRLLNSSRRTYASAITALQQSPYAFGTFIADGSIKAQEKEVRQMVVELADKTGLAFLKDIWIGGKDRDKVDAAGKVIRGMNETLRRLKDGEDDASLIDAMVAKGFHLVLSTREGRYRPAETSAREKAALRLAAERLITYRDQTYRRTELVRAMVYTLAYFSWPEPKPQTEAGTGPAQSE